MGAAKVKPQQFEYVGKYLLLEKLASGGMAEVWLARTTNSHGISKFLALKKILPHLTEDRDFVEMFKAEASIVVNLNHANIVPIFEFGEDDGQLYIVMDFIEGTNLAEFTKRLSQNDLQLSNEQVAYISKEIAAGLSHAHMTIDKSSGRNLNIVHRDISPQNVMIGYSGEVKLIDFGIAKATLSAVRTQDGYLKGKLAYLAPELIDSHPADAQSDLFCLGICMWEMLAGRQLFTGKSEFEYFEKIGKCEIPSLRELNESVDPELERIVMKALAKDRVVRYATVEALHRDIAGYLNRVAPDFSSQDFARNMRALYSREKKELESKLIQFAEVSKKVSNKAAGPQPVIYGYRSESAQLDYKEPRRIPFKLIFLFILLLKAFFIYSVEYQRIVLSSLPDRLKPAFLKFAGPFIDVSAEPPSEPVDPKVAEQPPAQIAEPDRKKYVNIDGQYYEYSPTGIYIINGNKVYFKVKRK